MAPKLIISERPSKHDFLVKYGLPNSRTRDVTFTTQRSNIYDDPDPRYQKEHIRVRIKSLDRGDPSGAGYTFVAHTTDGSQWYLGYLDYRLPTESCGWLRRFETEQALKRYQLQELLREVVEDGDVVLCGQGDGLYNVSICGGLVAMVRPDS